MSWSAERLRLGRAAVLVVVAAALFVACTGGGERRGDTEPRQRADTSPTSNVVAGDGQTGPGAVVYAERDGLFRYDIASGDKERVATLPSADVAVSPDGSSYVAVAESDPAGSGPEGFSRPVLLLGSLQRGGEPHELGPGRAPLWHPDGNQIAAIAPAGQGETIVVYRADGGAVQEPQPAVGVDRWAILGWSGAVVVGLAARPPEVVLGRPGDEAQALPFAPAEVWGASPAEARLLIIGDQRSYFAPAQGEDTGETVEVALGEARLADGAWSPDGATVVAAAITLSKRGSLDSDLLAIDATSGDVTKVPNSAGAQGQVVWDNNSDNFIYARTTASGRRLQAVLCSKRLECEDLFSWTEAVQLLALTHAAT